MANYVDLASLHDPVPRAKPPASWGAQIRENDEFFYANRRHVCTSSTRPAGFEGLEIYETDTNLVYLHNGSAFVLWGTLGAWLTYTPTITGAGTALGNGTITGAYSREGTTLRIQIVWTLGTTSTVGAGGVAFSLPSATTGVTRTNLFQQCSAMYNDTGTAIEAGVAYCGSGASTLVCNAFSYNGAAAGVAYVGWSALSATVPHTWANTDFISVNGVIEVA